jgi:endonuclease G
MRLKYIEILFLGSSVLLLNGCSGVDGSDTNETIRSCDTIIDKGYYEICYDYKYKGALFVSYSLDGEKVYENNIEQRDDFYIEPSLPREYASSSDDYIGSGYDRGHLASDASFDYSEDALYSVYSMANIVPQDPDLNRYLWIDTEYYERQKAAEFGSVDVVIGVVYPENPMQIGVDFISVPSAFYKSISNTQYNFQECYFYENIPSTEEDGSLEEHSVDCNSLVLHYN